MVTVTEDKLLQCLLLSWCFTSLLQGIAGFGVPVAVVAPIMVVMGFNPRDSGGYLPHRPFMGHIVWIHGFLRTYAIQIGVRNPGMEMIGPWAKIWRMR